MKAIITAIAVALFLGGCASYEIGDATDRLTDIQASYCAETDPIKRAVLLTVLKSNFPDYPTSGACTDLMELVDVEVEDAEQFEDFQREYKQALKDAEKVSGE